MISLQWSILFLCLSAHAENVKSGGNFTMECSTVACPTSVEDHNGMYVYLYRSAVQRKDVLYFYHKESGDEVTPRKDYSRRIQTQGTMKENTITISNLTESDTGVYTCVYQRFYPTNEVLCSIYILMVNEDVPYPTQVATMQCPNKSTPPLVLIVIVTCAVTMLVAVVIFILLFVPRVKRCTGSKGRRCEKPQASPDSVYEEMSRSGFRPPATTEQSAAHP